jgi:hypothetical protein
MLKTVDNPASFKKLFAQKFHGVLAENPKFKMFVYEALIYGTAYIVGGYLRDILSESESRDVDIILTIPTQRIVEILNEVELDYELNRLNGIKIRLDILHADVWSIEANWAFKNGLVKRNDDYILERIANGSFYNYDSLVLNIHSRNFYFANYNNFVDTKTLDILQKADSYKLLNPTVEANILRAIYLRKAYNVEFSENCNNYLLSRIGSVRDSFGSPVDRLLEFKRRYEKYDSFINRIDILKTIDYCFSQTIQKKLLM